MDTAEKKPFILNKTANRAAFYRLVNQTEK